MAAMNPPRASQRNAQRGAAIVTALLVVTLASVIVSALFYRESVSVRSIENEGSVFSIELPLHRPAHGHVATVAAS